MKTINFSLKALALISILTFTFGCNHNNERAVNEANSTLTDDSLMTLVQARTFDYFWDGAEPNSGMARERFHEDGDYPHNDKNVVAIGGSGFGIMGILVGIE